MKNFFKLGFVALALSLSVVACNSENKAEGTDSPAVDTSAVAPVDTTVHADTTAAAPVAATPAAH